MHSKLIFKSWSMGIITSSGISVDKEENTLAL